MITLDTVSTCGNTNQLQINVGPNLSIPQLADSLAICPGDSVQVGVDGLPYFFSWSGSDSLSSSSVGNPNFYDIQSVKLQVIFSDFDLTCSGSDSVFVEVYTLPSLGVLEKPHDSACIATDFNLGLNLDANVTYNWSSVGGPVNSDPLNPIFNFNLAGDFTIDVQMLDQNSNCMSDDSLVVRIHPKPTLFPFPTYTERTCRTDVHTLELNADTSFEYDWSIKEGMVFNSDSSRPSFQVILPIDRDSIFVNFLDRNGCSAMENMILDILYKPDAIALTEGNEAGTNYVVSDDQRIIDELNVSNPNLMIQWYVNGVEVQTNVDSIGWFLRDDFSHGDTVQAKYTRLNGPDTLCTFWSDDYIKTNLGSVEEVLNSIYIYPNPIKNGSAVHWTSNLQIEQLRITDLGGREIEQGPLEEVRLESSGVYFLHFKSRHRWYVKRLIVY